MEFYFKAEFELCGIGETDKTTIDEYIDRLHSKLLQRIGKGITYVACREIYLSEDPIGGEFDRFNQDPAQDFETEQELAPQGIRGSSSDKITALSMMLHLIFLLDTTKYKNPDAANTNARRKIEGLEEKLGEVNEDLCFELKYIYIMSSRKYKAEFEQNL